MSVVSPQPATRRRGTALTEAIFLATLDELARTSFAELSFDKIATAAGTGKAALYRRWSTPSDLVLAALTDPATGFGGPLTPPRTGTLRGDLIELLTHFGYALTEPRGRALRPLIADRHQHPALFDRLWESVIRPAHEVLLHLLTEANPAAATPLVAAVGPRMLLMQAWLTDAVSPADVTAVVDEILVPLLTAARTPTD